MPAILIAFGSAIAGALLGAYLQKLWTPDLSGEIASLRQQVAQFQQRIDTLEKERASQREEDSLWTSKFESAASQVVKIGPSLTVPSPQGNSIMPLYGLVFPNVDTRTRVQTFLVEPDSRYTSFSMRMLTAEHLRRPIVRQVVQETLECLRTFRMNHPDLAARYLAEFSEDKTL